MPARKPSGSAVRKATTTMTFHSQTGSQPAIRSGGGRRGRRRSPRRAAPSTQRAASRARSSAASRVGGGGGACSAWTPCAVRLDVRHFSLPSTTRRGNSTSAVELVLRQRLEGLRHHVRRKALLDVGVGIDDRLVDELLERLPAVLRVRRAAYRGRDRSSRSPRPAFSVWHAPQPLFTKTALPAAAPPPPPPPACLAGLRPLVASRPATSRPPSSASRHGRGRRARCR